MNDRATEALAGGPTRDAWAEAQGLGQVVVRAARRARRPIPPRAREKDEDKESRKKAFNKRAMLPGFREGTSVWTLRAWGPSNRSARATRS